MNEFFSRSATELLRSVKTIQDGGHLHQILRLGAAVPGVFLSFEFQKGRSKNVVAVWGRNFPSPFDTAHRLYNSLLLPHRP